MLWIGVLYAWSEFHLVSIYIIFLDAVWKYNDFLLSLMMLFYFFQGSDTLDLFKQWALLFEMAMEVLKKRVMQMRLDIENADEKYKVIRRELKLATERADQSEAEAEGLKRKKKVNIENLEKTEEAFEIKILRIKAQEEVSDDSEKERKVLEQAEYDHNDQLAVLSVKVIQAKKHADEVEQKLKEAVERLKVVQKENSKALNRVNTADSKIAYLEEECDIGMRTLMKKEWQEQGHIRKEDIYEDKIEFLETKYRHTVVRADDLDQDARVLETQKEKLKGETSFYGRYWYRNFYRPDQFNI